MQKIAIKQLQTVIRCIGAREQILIEKAGGINFIANQLILFQKD
jgi:hypothetical protein